MSFFVTSTRSTTGDLGGLSGADRRCQELGAAAGFGAKAWRAYLSVERDAANGNQPTHARDRIGSGPWFNANGVMVAAGLNDLHTRRGDAEVFVDEHNQRIAGQWNGSPRPVEHHPHRLHGRRTADAGHDLQRLDVGFGRPGPQVGHSDGLGPN